MTNPVPERRWSIQGAVVGGVTGAVAYFLSCRWLQHVLMEEGAKYNLTHPNPEADRLLAFAAGVGALGLVVGAISGARASPAIAAGMGAALGTILPGLGG